MGKNNFINEKASAQICIDMHCHSSFSDGNLSPEQVAKNLSDSGVTYAALADHNTLAGLASFRRALTQYGIGFVSGIEITTEHKSQVLHLLAYGFDPDFPELLALLRKKDNNKETSNGTNLRSFLTAAQIIELIHRAGGIIVFAHPIKTEPDIEKLQVIIDELQKLGLDGIEAIYGYNSVDEENKLVEIAAKSNLLVSAGTDYHTQNGITPGITIPTKIWKLFRDALLKSSSDFIQGKTLHSPTLPKKQKNKWFSFVRNILLPAFLSLVLFIIALFVFLLPYFEETLLERKRENISQLIQVAWGVLNQASEEVEKGLLSLEKAQDLAKDRISAMRYGLENKDYFWLQDTSPRILMHPYRTDLNDQDVSDFQDAQGTRIFVAFSDLVLDKGEGYISYAWQWKDDIDRIEPKESYIRLFEPWGWIIGTGIYLNDVQAEIDDLRGYIVKISIAIIFMVLLLLLYLIRQGVRIEKSRSEAEQLLLESTERYQALSEAATEGALFVYDQRCRYANTVMYELLGCNSDKIELLGLHDVFPDIQDNKEWLGFLSGNLERKAQSMINGVVKRLDGTLLSCHFSVKKGINDPESGFMVLVRRSLDVSGHTGTYVALNRLLHIPSSIASDIAESIKNASQVNEVAVLCKKTSGLVVSLLENGTSSIAISYMISTISDLVLQKIIDLSINEIGDPPVPYTFLTLGSHGRQSVTLFSDQDNAIIYKLSGKEDEKAVQEYFLKLGTMVCDAFELAGYRKCTGRMIASNPDWCKSLSIWKAYFEEWIRNPEPQKIVEFSILFDFRPVSGAAELAAELRDFIYSEIAETPFFLSLIAQNALIFKTPMRLFGNIVASGGKNHPGRIDVKTPVLAIVGFARLYSLKHTIRESNTLLQLDKIKGLGILLDSEHRDIVAAYETLMRLRLWNQVLAIEHNQQLDNWISHGKLSRIEEVVLKASFKEIDDLQGLIQRDFLN